MTSSSQTFVVRVAYIQPSFEELKRRFPTYVNPNYKVKRLNQIKLRKTIPTDVGNSEVSFEYVCMDNPATTDEVLVEMNLKGLSPALYEELLSFSEKYPDEQLKYPVVALGSETRVYGFRHVAFMWRCGNGQRLDLGWLGGKWVGNCRFLAVRR